MVGVGKHSRKTAPKHMKASVARARLRNMSMAAALAAIAMGGGVGTSVALASTVGSAEVHACLSPATDTYRMAPAGAPCARGDVAVSWHQASSQG